VAFVLTVALLASTTAPRAAHAQETARDRREACFSASERAQLLRNQGKLHAARAELLVCAADPCPSQMRRDCSKWLAEVESSIATVVLEVHDASGRERIDVRVTLDGEDLTDRLDGRPLEMDPGEHVFRFAVSDGQSAEQRIVAHAGDRMRRIVVTLERASPARLTPDTTPTPPELQPTTRPPPPPARDTVRASTPWPVYALGTLAVVTGAVGGGLAVAGLARENHLRSTCAPTCAHDDVSSLHGQYVAADVLFVVTGAAVAAALLFYLTRGDEAAPAHAGRVTLDGRY
jgi:hypothetical protein